MTINAKKVMNPSSRVGDHLALRPSAFLPYVRNLAALLDSGPTVDASGNRRKLVAALDGQPGRELRKFYLIDSLRNTGTYFTGSKLASRLVSSMKAALPKAELVIDPACGAGDLLVACARHFPLRSDLMSTLKDWGLRLAGFDINSAFVEATRYRLALLAVERGIGNAAFLAAQNLPLASLFPYIHAASGIEDWKLPDNPSLIVVNPPYSYRDAAKGCAWASGRVSQAATFIEHCLKYTTDETRILAVLPDVLRTGTRYERWRRMIEETARIRSVRIAGQFDDLTDISVFLLDLDARKPTKEQRINWARPSEIVKHRVKDIFDVHVGAVVPFRLDGGGSWFRYAHSEQLPPWEIVKGLNQRIRFKGTTFTPPLVAVRRTSKATYKTRCIGTIITGKEPIAVENHLLVLLPRDRTVSTCKKLLALLQQDATSRWMNGRIRCRHLTVSSIGELPWLED